MYFLDVAQSVKGSLTAAGNIGPLVVPQGKFWTFLMDATAVATANITVAIQVLNPQSGLYVTPSLIGSPLQANPFTITLGTAAPLIYLEGPIQGAQLNIASFGTSTGTFTGAIWVI